MSDPTPPHPTPTDAPARVEQRPSGLDQEAGVPSPLPVPSPAEVANTDDALTPADVVKVAKSTPKGAPKWQVDAKDRLKTTIRRMAKPLADLVSRDANEGDTRLFVTDLLCYGLGYDKYVDLTTEYQVKGEFADYGIRLDQQLVGFIEVKRCTTKLNEKHLRQVQMYAVNEGVEWMILTNGVVWQLYHLTGGLPITVDLVFAIDLLDDSTPINEKVGSLFYLSRESMKREQVRDVWQQALATAPATVAAAVVSGPVVDAVRKEIKRQTGRSLEASEVLAALRTGVLRPDLI